MGQLVLHDLGDSLLGRGTAGLLVVEEVHHSVGDEAPILHGAGAEVGDGDHVHLGQGKGAVKGLLVIVEGSRGKLERESAVFDVLVGRGEDAHRHSEA